MLRPVELPCGTVEGFSGGCLEAGELEEYPVGEPRLETGAICGLQRAGESHPRRALPYFGGAEGRQLLRHQIGEPARCARQELAGRHDARTRVCERAWQSVSMCGISL